MQRLERVMTQFHWFFFIQYYSFFYKMLFTLVIHLVISLEKISWVLKGMGTYVVLKVTTE